MGLKSQIFRRKPIAMLVGDGDSKAGGLKRVLGALDLTALGIGAIIGAGIFTLTGVGALSAGPAITFSFVIAGFACAMAALCYAEFAAMIPVAGSAYSYAYATMGELIGWIVGWNLILEYAVGAAAVAAAWSGYLGAILHGFGVKLPVALSQAPGTAADAIINLPALLIVLLVTAILCVGISESARVNSIIVGIKLLVIAILVVVGVFFVRPKNWFPFAPRGWHGMMQGAALIFFAYIGFDAVSTAAEEVKDPSRDLPRGILYSLLICTIIYILVAAVLTGMVPYRLIDVSAPLASAFLQRGLLAVANTISIGAIAGLTSVLLVLLLGQSRIFFAMSRDRLLPAVFSRIHPRFRTPYVPTILTGCAVGLTAALLPLEEIAKLTNIGTLFAFVIVCIAVWTLRHTEPSLARPFRIRMMPLVPILGILSCGYLMASLPAVTWIRFVVWLVAGLAVYLCYGRWHSRVGGIADETGRRASTG